MIKRIPIQTYAKIRICDNCKVGEMKPTNSNIMLTCNPPKFEHTCSVCETKDYYTEKYPNIINTYIEEDLNDCTGSCK